MSQSNPQTDATPHSETEQESDEYVVDPSPEEIIEELARHDREADDDIQHASEDIVDHLMYLMGVDFLDDKKYHAVMVYLNKRLDSFENADQN